MISAFSFTQGHFSTLALGASWPLLVAGFYVAGLALSVTPCCLPLVPIIGGLIVRQQPTPNMLRSLALSASYVLGMALTYTLGGAVFAAAGANLQAYFQTPWAVYCFSALFLALGLSMLGLFSLQAPSSLQSRFSALSARQNAASFGGIALMGALSTLIVTACVAPALIGALAVAARAGTALRGSLALFSLGLGMGTPLVVFGVSAGRLRPKSGPWMETIKKLYGAVFIGISVYLLGRVVPNDIEHLLWSLPFFVAAFSLIISAPRAPSRGLPLLGLSAACALIAAYFLVPADLFNSFNPSARAPAAQVPLRFVPIESLSALRTAIKQASLHKRPVVVDFWANWCTACKEMDATTFSNETVKRTLRHAVLLRVDLTRYNKAERAILSHFGLYGPPTILFFNAEGHLLKRPTVVGYMPAGAFETTALKALSSHA